MTTRASKAAGRQSLLAIRWGLRPGKATNRGIKRNLFPGGHRPQGTHGPACRSPNGADLRKGNHLVCRLPTLIAPLVEARYPRRPKISLRRMRNIDAGQRISNLRDKRGQAE